MTSLQAELLLIVIVLFSSSVNCKDTCTADADLPSCVCTMSDGSGKIDLRPIAHHDGTAAFQIKGKDKDTYSYNPCYNFTDGGCANVAGCQDSGGKRSIGTQKAAAINTNDRGIVSIAYGDGYKGRNMVVHLVCDATKKTAVLKFDNEVAKNQYAFTLTTECACPGTCNEGGVQKKSHHSSSSKIGVVGLVILSILVILIVVYFVAGMILMRVKYEKTGSDIIPNKAFWMTLPFLVKDGCVFTCTPCIRYYNNRSKGYSNI